MTIKHTFLSLVFFVFSLTLFAQEPQRVSLGWEEVPFESTMLMGNPRIHVKQGKVFKLSTLGLSAALGNVTYREGNLKGTIAAVSFPYEDGTIHSFTAKRNQTMHPLLNEKFPEIVTLDAYATDGSGAFGKWDVTPSGLHAMLFIPGESTLFIDPLFDGNNEYYLVYRKKDFITHKTVQCGVENMEETKPNAGEKSMFGTCELRTYRLALSATAEYTSFHGGTVNQAAAAQVVTMNRVNGVYEKDIAITMVIIPNNNSLIYTNASTDPYANGTPGTMINQNQTNTDNVIGSANYDIGHVFGTNSGGLAGLGVVCAGGQKARGVTGSAAPIGDPFDIDYVAHEMGHQFGGNHTQNNNCNSVAAARREPGSASTIMGYAGICAPNVQNNSDDYFHGYNLGEISSEILSNGHQCEVITPLNNSAPTITSTSGNIVVPISTPFILTGHATDPDGDVLTYLWEQMDNEATTQPPVATATGGPNFRSFNPTTDTSRYFPRLSALASNGPFTWEVLPSVARVMDFRLSVRDNHAVGSCNDFIDLTVTTNASAGPFVVTYPSASGITWPGGSSQTVTWSVANTDLAPINCSNVRILLSINGGQSYPYVLSASTPNDGSETILCPNVSTSTARIMVMSAAQTFFDVSNNNFTITCSGQDTPVFSGISTVCQNDSLFALPTISDNGISGSWTPAFTLNTLGTSPYTFTPVPSACATPYTASVTVNAQIQPTFNPFSAVCQNDAFTLPTLSNNNVSGVWTPAVNTQNPGNFSYTFSPNPGECATVVSQSLTIDPLPSNAVSLSGNTLTAQQSGAMYQWVDCDLNQAIVGATGQSYTPTQAIGSYAVTITLASCEVTSTCITIDQSGIDEGEIALTVFPNPSSQDITVTWNGSVSRLRLYNAAGKTVWEKSTQGVSEAIIPSHHIAAGVYYLNASHSQGEYTSKIMKY